MNLSEFQTGCVAALNRGLSTLVIAPTGLGKTIAAVEPFAATEKGLLGTRLVYSLPMRALASGVFDDLKVRLDEYGRTERKIALHHGQQPDSKLFCEQAVITTIDQYLTAWAGAPLSFASNSGHAAAGALLASYSVFDEVHLLDARAGLPLLFAMLSQRREWGLRSCVMTATLPENVIEHFRKYLGLEVVRASEEDVNYRDMRRRVTVRYRADVAPEVEARKQAVLEAWKEHRRVIVFCNTVPTALEMYEALYEEVGKENILLAHSRFAPTERRTRDLEVTERFGKGDRSGILVTTQVAEAGLNISAPAVFSVLAPADSLIQRAGRCARFFRDADTDNPIRGEFTVWPLLPLNKPLNEKEREKLCLPYDSGVVAKTLEALQEDLDGKVLDWKKEQAFVNRSLSDFYAAFIGGRKNLAKPKKDNAPREPKAPAPLTPVTALGAFERAFHTADAKQVEGLLRDSVTVNVGVVENFQEAEDAYNVPGTNAGGKPMPRRYPETISLRLSAFDEMFMRKGAGKQVREAIVTRLGKRNKDVGRDTKKPLELKNGMRPRPGRTYFVLASEAGYSSEKGLAGAGSGQPTQRKSLPLFEKGQREEDGTRQTFDEHACGAYTEAKRLTALYRPFLLAWAEGVPREPQTTPEDIADALQSAMEMAALLHDVGKLNDEWQQAIGRRADESPVARTTETERAELKKQGKPRPPYHAQYVYPFLKYLLRQQIGEYRMLDHLALAAARHHVVRLDGDIELGEFCWTLGGKEAVRQVVVQVFGDIVSEDTWTKAYDLLKQNSHADEAPGPSAYNFFLYCLTNRLVIHADRCDAAGGKQQELAEGKE